MEDFAWITGDDPELSHLEKIAAGSFGEVHMMQKRMTGEVFARKLIRPFATLTEEDVQNEARAITKLCIQGHQNIVKVYGHNHLKGSVYYAIDMEYCELTLADYISGNREGVVKTDHLVTADGTLTQAQNVLKWHDLVRIMQDIVKGLEFIHSNNEIHRDLKPNNILYSISSKLWKITDFGFTTEGSSKRIILSSAGRGTQSYRAPELIREVPIYTRKVDIWALGCIFYELVTGTKAFQNDWQAREYGLSSEKLTIPKIDYHHRSSKQFFTSMMRQMLHKEWLLRPSTKRILEDFEDFNLHLLDHNHTLCVEFMPGVTDRSVEGAPVPRKVTVAPVRPVIRPIVARPIVGVGTRRKPKCHHCRKNKKKCVYEHPHLPCDLCSARGFKDCIKE